ncbi:hypothetical protein VTK26DRAFT_8406 [Humicola hyalothermophila]
MVASMREIRFGCWTSWSRSRYPSDSDRDVNIEEVGLAGSFVLQDPFRLRNQLRGVTPRLYLSCWPRPSPSPASHPHHRAVYYGAPSKGLIPGCLSVGDHFGKVFHLPAAKLWQNHQQNLNTRYDRNRPLLAPRLEIWARRYQTGARRPSDPGAEREH